jgi:hypothetical protein
MEIDVVPGGDRRRGASLVAGALELLGAPLLDLLDLGLWELKGGRHLVCSPLLSFFATETTPDATRQGDSNDLTDDLQLR